MVMWANDSIFHDEIGLKRLDKDPMKKDQQLQRSIDPAFNNNAERDMVLL